MDLRSKLNNVELALTRHLGECSVQTANTNRELRDVKRALRWMIVTSGGVLFGMVAVLIKNLLHL